MALLTAMEPLPDIATYGYEEEIAKNTWVFMLLILDGIA
jgi:hypothetical protein